MRPGCTIGGVPLCLEPMSMRLAILGTRGVPANYGGFETFAEELGSRLAERGHEVTVYGRDRVRRARPARPTAGCGWSGCRRHGPSTSRRWSTACSRRSTRSSASYDIVYICNSANVPAVDRPAGARAEGRPQRRRARMAAGQVERGGSRLLPGVRLARRAPAGRVVTDARVIQDYYRSAYGRETEYFPYGTTSGPTDDDGTLARLGLEPRRLRPVRQPAGAGEQRARGHRGVRAASPPTCRS